MFGIEDPLIWLPYLLMVGCVVFSLWYGLKNWHKEDREEGKQIDKGIEEQGGKA